MWTEGEIEISGVRFEYWAKHFENGSEYGIDGGRISKLHIRRDDIDVVNYDRGWDVYPEDELDKQAYEEILDEFN